MRLKKTLLYIALVLVLALGVYAVFTGFLTDCARAVSGGAGGTEWYDVFSGGDGKAYVLGERNGSTVLRTVDINTGRGKTEKLALPSDAENCRVDALCPDRTGYLISLYTYENGEIGEYRAVWVSADTGKAQTLVSRPCEGTGDAARLASVRASAFTADTDSLGFLLWQDGVCTLYSFTPTTGDLAVLGTAPAETFHTGLLFSGGEAMLVPAAGRDFSIGDYAYQLPEGAVISDLWRTSDEVYYLDGAAAAVKRLNPATLELQTAYDLSGGDTVSVSVTSAGALLRLTDGGRLTLETADGTTELTAGLGIRRGTAILLLAVIAVGILFFAYVLWFTLAEVQRLRVSLVVRHGAALAVCAAVVAVCALRLGAEPALRQAARTQAQAGMSAAAGLLDASGDTDDGTLTALAATLARTDDSFREAEVLLLHRSGDGYIVKSSSCGADGTAAAALLRGSGFIASLDGGGFTSRLADGTRYYTYASALSASETLAVTVCARQFDAGAAAAIRWARLGVWGLAALLVLLSLIALLRVRRGILRVTRGMDTVGAGNSNVEVVETSGDEVESLADSLNTLTHTLRGAESGSSRSSEAYMRFVPRQILTLLGAASIEEVGKETFASRRLATMQVRFSFEEEVYESRTRALFDNINEVIERTSGIIPQNNGTIYSFSYEGYDALFPPDTDECVSAAVAIRQEVIALNRERARRGVSAVTLHVALDVGEVMLGVVGSDTRMEATAISSSFNTTRRLISLFSRFKANILCTEEIVNGAASYSSRYIGKTRDGEAMIRVFEIFDGDAYGVRTGKANTAQQFAEGVLTLYSRDFAGAKRIFMDVARQNSNDGVAKFCLYLADKFEKDEPDEVSLDS